MSFTLTRGVVVLSIDLEIDPTRRLVEQQQYLEQGAADLIRLLEKYQMPATWGVADPALSALTDRLLSARTPQEIAILGDGTWVGHEAGRSRFSRELVRRVTRARAAGLNVSTLLLRGTELDDHFDTAVKHGLTAVRGADDPSEAGWFLRATLAPPEQLRFGLWEVPVAAVLPAARGWFGLASGARAAKSGIDRAGSTPAVFHLKIDGLLLAVESAARQLEQVLRHLDRRRQSGLIAVATLADIAANLSGRRQAMPARSILRPAA